MYNDHVQHKLFHMYHDQVLYVVHVDHDQIQAKKFNCFKIGNNRNFYLGNNFN